MRLREELNNSAKLPFVVNLHSVFMNECVCVWECVSLLGCCNVLDWCTSVQMEKLFQLEAVRLAGRRPDWHRRKKHLLRFYGGLICVNTDWVVTAEPM